ncbi:DUF4395 domain-containing protein [Phaeovulum sp.]|uniref:DUF4395 domain-containing protein n=1 Tax=Phaeovulum sp. TaxID=2934796 RepID=UPI0027320A0E|nr:DUF4395 domain-containing protein [Phaeovulum sp.]MDP1669435.1 DUF4395 domain-containing protein [Phaeovulum sp.]MDZ4118286.1 DUF4395 domain-containing protein [Phaeovulum sp.]
MARVFDFGEVVEGYPIRVVNEREARAGAGILLLFGLIAFSQAFLNGSFAMTRMVILVFAVDFALRVLVNPRFAPSLILGRYMVRKQVPDYVGAAQKRFAWGLGLAIALFMIVWNLVLNQAGPVALLGCVTCILLLFFETSFGICVGCAIYNWIWPGQAQLCPGGVCEVPAERPSITRLGWAQGAVVLATLAAIIVVSPVVAGMQGPRYMGPGAATQALVTAEGVVVASSDCVVPAFAKALGHAEEWKLHNGC